MNERIKEIIEHLMNPKSIDTGDQTVVNKELEDMGYSQDEIRKARKIAATVPPPATWSSMPDENAHTRILGESEKLLLSTQAQGYLINLHHMGWISEAQLSLIIENAGLELTPPATIDEIKDLTLRYVLDLPDEIHDKRENDRKKIH